MLCTSCHQWKDLEDFKSKLKNKPQNMNCRKCLDIKEGNKMGKIMLDNVDIPQPKKIMTPE